MRGCRRIGPLSSNFRFLEIVEVSHLELRISDHELMNRFLDGMVTDEIEGAIEEGVPNHPLYTHIAAALYRWISTGRFPRNMPPMPGINEDESWKAQMEIWTTAVLTEGSQLLQVLHIIRTHLGFYPYCFQSIFLSSCNRFYILGEIVFGKVL